MNLFKKITVVGAGTMGHGIALACAMGRTPVMLVDVQKNMLLAAEKKIREALQTIIECGLVDPSDELSVLSAITYTDSLATGVDGADLVIETITERLELKEKLYNDLEQICSPETIISTNTSSLPVTQLAAMTQRPDRFVGTHFFNPPHVVPLVEVVQGPQTTEETIEKTMAFMAAIGKHPVHVRVDLPGFIANRIQLAMIREALSLAQKGIASPEDIDNVIKKSVALRLIFIGPLEQRDFSGLDVHVAASGYLYPFLEDTKQPVQILVDKVAAGHCGMKTGKGFYDWTGKDIAKETAAKNKKMFALMRFLDTLED